MNPRRIAAAVLFTLLAACSTAAPDAAQSGAATVESRPDHATATAPGLAPDEFDRPAPASVAEAVKAANNVPDGDIRHIVPGTDRENAPTPMPPFRDSLAAGAAPAHDAAPAGHSTHGGVERATIYVCPMHPEVTSDKPGTCPKCGMALVKKPD